MPVLLTSRYMVREGATPQVFEPGLANPRRTRYQCAFRSRREPISASSRQGSLSRSRALRLLLAAYRAMADVIARFDEIL